VDVTDAPARSSPRRALTGAAALAGLLLFAYAVREAGPREIADGIRRVGWGLVPILAIGGLRFALRAESWRLCMPPSARMPFGRAFSAFLAGDAVGNVTPLGPIASEPAKVFLSRHRLATAEAVSSLAIDNIVYGASVMTMIAAGSIVVLATIPLPAVWQDAAVVTLAGLVVAAALGFRLMRGFWTGAKGARPAWRERLFRLRASVVEFSAGHPARLWRVYSIHMGFHALTVVETYLTLRWLIGDTAVTVPQAIAFAALNRVVQVAFKFVPFLVGVDEASSGALAPLLNVDLGSAVTMPVVRKIRVLFWTGAGLLLTAAHPARAGRATDRPGTEPAHRT
jgi:hypothetical protein